MPFHASSALGNSCSGLVASAPRVVAACATLLLVACGGEAARTEIRQHASAAADPAEARPVERSTAGGSTVASGEAAAYTTEEVETVRLVNAARAEHRLAPLAIEPGLMVLARKHAALMAARDDILHMGVNPPAGRKAGVWPKFAENAGTSTSIAGVHAALLRSPGHRANILGAFTHIGVGVVEGVGGQLYVMQIFVHE